MPVPARCPCPCAAGMGDSEMAALLLAASADPLAETSSGGRTVAELAALAGGEG